MHDIVEVFAVANAIYNKYGFVKKAVSSLDNPSSAYRMYTYFNNAECVVDFAVTDDDREQAQEMIEYFKGLSFKVFERELSDFETNIVRAVKREEVDSSSLGMIATLPKIYYQNIAQDEWAGREAALAMKSEFAGTLKTRNNFKLVVENIRELQNGSKLYCCSENNQNIVKFFGEYRSIEKGDSLNLAGFVKEHKVSDHHRGKETMINRVTIKDANGISNFEEQVNN
jgi:hypothetical protein